MIEFERWLERVQDDECKNELLSVKGMDKEIEDRFYKSLSFGTGGLRKIIGAGTNRMNIYLQVKSKDCKLAEQNMQKALRFISECIA